MTVGRESTMSEFVDFVTEITKQQTPLHYTMCILV